MHCPPLFTSAPTVYKCAAESSPYYKQYLLLFKNHLKNHTAVPSYFENLLTLFLRIKPYILTCFKDLFFSRIQWA